VQAVSPRRPWLWRCRGRDQHSLAVTTTAEVAAGTLPATRRADRDRDGDVVKTRLPAWRCGPRVRWVPFAVLGQQLRGGLGDSRFVTMASGRFPRGVVSARKNERVSRDLAHRPGTDEAMASGRCAPARRGWDDVAQRGASLP